MIPRLERLADIDAESFFTPDPILRLAALLPPDLSHVAAVTERWKLSNAQRERLEAVTNAKLKVVPYLSVREIHKALYRFGVDRFKDIVFLRWAEDLKMSNAMSWRAMLAQADSWPRPKFPLTGRDVMMAGVPEGPLVGHILSEVEEWWIDADFIEDEFSLAERLKAVVQATAY
jgi:poly(A) polymerase